ncbi:transposase [Aurantiacibacter sediminis]|uniref:Transposase n=1 Tax=Aurantiacibacter sediminis TaxID=2793064 RepID=A0ABS0N2C6_9SPHN|nr:transposase [Aurantiacibacter sediminis]MBH5322068.1 transposase [Aurantiacibacter sediminis]
MPRVIHCEDTSSCELGECIEALHDEGFNPWEENSLLGAARWLRRLNNNREFLADLMVEELKHGPESSKVPGDYGPQTIMLSALGSEFYLRANLWPSRDEHMFRASGQSAFSYGLPHDHNFDFLTVGYFGPGYASDYYEYDYEAVAGVVGEKAKLRFVERSTLSPGKLMHYRAHRDVHSQLPPESLSVSLNIMHAGGAQGWLDQYRFDVENDVIAGVVSSGGSEIFLRMAVGLGGDEARDLAHHFAGSHPSDRIRLVALEAQAGVMDRDAQDALWRAAESSGSRLIAGEARRRREALELA